MKKFLIPFLAGVFLIILIAAQPKIGDRGVVLETNGFATNLTVATGISIGATNLIPLLATATRPAFIATDGTITNVSGTPTGSKFVRDDGVLAVPAGTSSGTVTAVGLNTVPGQFGTNAGSVTTSGTLGFSNVFQPANTFFAGPTTGAAANPTNRVLVTADLPAGVGTVTAVGLNTIPAQFGTNAGSVTTSGNLGFSNVFQAANTFLSGPSTGSAANPAYRVIALADLPTGTIQDVVNLTNISVYSSSATVPNEKIVGIAAGSTNLTEWYAPGGILRSMITSNGVFMASTGTVTAPVFASSTRPTTGIYFDSAIDGVLMSLSGAAALRLDANALRIGPLMSFSASVPASGDVSLGREAANNLQLGLDAATPSTNTFKGPDGSGADKTGGTLIIEPGQSTGTGAGGSLITKTSLTAAGTSSTANSFSTRAFISAKDVTLTESSATLAFNITLAASKYAGIKLFATTHADNGTDFQVVTEIIAIAAVNKAGTVTTAVSAPATTATLTSSGTLTTAWTAVANGNGIDIKNNAVSSLTQTTLATKWRIEIDSDDTPLITAQ